MFLTDTHAHLISRTYEGQEDEIISRALEAGVGRIVTIGCDVESSRAGLALAERYPEVWAAVGVHPAYVTEEPHEDWLPQLAALARHPKCVAVGEAGLDHYHPAPEGWVWEDYLRRQEEFFSAQLELAAECGKNIVVHQRDRSGSGCWDAVRRLVDPWQGRLRAVFHCWLHGWEEAVPVVAQGHLISFTGIVTYKNAPLTAACAREAPAGSFMLETDSPYLSPVPHRGKRNEPARLRDTAEWLAAARGETPASLAAATNAVAEKFFGFDAGWSRREDH